jgi:antitoxin component YwqK of YwqJK toxin-antitoxin module
LFVVCSFVSNATTGTVFAKSINTTQNGRIVIMRNPNISVFYYHPSIVLDASNNAYPVNTYQILELIVNRTEGIDYSFQNGALLSSKLVSDATNYADTANVMLIGAHNNTATTPLAGYYLNGKVAEILSYKSTDMSSMTRQRVEGYLAWKWGIQSRLLSNHAYRNSSPPLDITNTPIPLRIGVSLWLDSTDLSTITKDASNRVEKWKDKSFNAFEFNQTTAGFKPTYTENSQNGKATISFRDTSSNYLAGPTNFSIDTSSFALFAVCKFNDNVSTGTVFAKSFFAASDGRFFINRDGPTLNVIYTHPNSSWLSSTSDTYPTGEYRMLELIVNRIESKDYSYQNGNSLSTPLNVSDTTNYINTNNNMLIGAYNNNTGTGVQAGYFLNGNVAEIIAYKNAHIDKATRETIEGYLAWKWGLQSKLPGTHTYKSSAPI